MGHTSPRTHRVRSVITTNFSKSADNYAPGTRQFAQIAIGPGSSKEEVAQWVHNRSEFVRHNRNSVFIAVNAIARKMAMSKVNVGRVITKKGIERVEPVKYSHPLRELFRQVNPEMNQWELWYYTEGWKLLTGDAFTWKAQNRYGITKQLWPMPSQWVHSIPDRDRYVSGYRVESYFGGGTEAVLPRDQVIHIREPNLDWSGSGRFYGYAPLAAAASSVEIEANMFERLNASFKNYAQPGQIFSTEQRLTESQLRSLYGQIIGQHGLAEHFGKPMITHAGLKPMMQQASVREMDYGKSLEVTMSLTLAVFGVPKAVVGLVADQNRCLDEETECLTDSGWKNYRELTMQTKIACFDPETETLVYRKPSGVFVNKYSGKMYHWKSKVADVMVTPNHRLLGTTEYGQTSTRIAEDWVNQTSRLKIPVAPANGAACEPAIAESIPGTAPTFRSLSVPDSLQGSVSANDAACAVGASPASIHSWSRQGMLSSEMRDGARFVDADDLRSLKIRTRGASTRRIEPVSIDADLWLQFLGWFVSEGYSVERVDKKGRKACEASITQGDKKAKYVSEIHEMVGKLPFKFHHQKPVEGMNRWACNDSGLVRYLRKVCGGSSLDMRVPAHIKDYPAESLKIFLGAALKGDGSFAPRHALSSYTTVSKGLADDIQEIAVKCGFRASVSEQKRKTCKGNLVYVVNIAFERREVLLRHDKNLSEVNYDGDVWCVEVPTSYFVVRRNGKVHITGNSNLLGALQGFIENVIEPRLAQNAQHLTYGIARDFDERLVVTFDKMTVNDREQIRKEVETLARFGGMTPNEQREVLLDGMFKNYKSGGDQPLKLAGAEELPFGNLSQVEIDEMTEASIEALGGAIADPPPQNSDETDVDFDEVLEETERGDRETA